MKNLINSKIQWQILFLIIVTALTAAVFVKSLKTGIESHHEIVSSLRLAQQLDHERNETILKIRSFMLGSYDQLVNINAKHEFLNIRIEKKLRQDLGKDALPTLEKFFQYDKEIRESTAKVELFKSTQSIFKNSLTYLPMAVKEIKNKELSTQATLILNQLFIFQQGLGEVNSQEIKKELKALIAKSNKVSPDDKEALVDFERHAVILIDYGTQRSKIEKSIFDKKIDESLTALEKKYFKTYSLREKNMNTYRSLLLMFCGFLGMGVVVLVTRVQRIGIQLQELNLNLEKKVIARTSQLNNALAQLEEKQQMLIQSTKMSALGEMAGGIAHEINTPLGTILLYAQININKATKAGHTEYIEISNNIIKTVERIAKIITGLRRFSRDSSQSEKTESPIQEIFNDTMTLCSEKIKNKGIDIRIHPTSELLFCVPEQISQVILNLLNNSIDAVEVLSEKWIDLSVENFENKIAIVVTDSGSGIDLKNQQKLMQPFFTTKEIGKGTGLGLSISKGIIESHGGHLFYEPSSKNTQFKIILPALKKEQQAS